MADERNTQGTARRSAKSEPSRRIQRLIRPEALKKEEPLLWSPGRGTDVWNMFCAAITGDVATIEKLLEKDPSLARCSYEYRTPLSFAIQENQVEAAAYLFDHGARAFGNPLEIARDRGFVEMERMLEERLARTAGVSRRGELVAEAIRERNLPKVRALLDASPELVHAADERSNQPIHWAVMTRQIEMIDELLERGADVNARRDDGARPIQLTIGDYLYRGWTKKFPTTPREVLAHLRSRGAYCDICTASYIGDRERVRGLLEDDPSLANRPSEYVTYYACSGTPLRNASAAGHIDIVRLLLEYGADPNLPEEGIAPRGHALYSAVYNGHHEIAELLLEKGAYPNAPVESSADALSIAILRGDRKMIDLLCSYGAARSVALLAHYNDLQTAAAVFAVDPALADDPGALGSAASEQFVRLMLLYQPELPRHVSVAKSRPVTELLFRHGMNPNRPDWLRITELHRFAERGDVENAAIFVAHGADLDAQDEEFRSTPLGYASRAGKRRIVEFLLRQGADPNLPDDPTWAKPVAWADRRGHTAIAILLREFIERGTLPPAPLLERYESLAEDLVLTYNSRDAAAAERVVAYFEIDTRAWKTGDSSVEAVCRQVRERLHRLPDAEPADNPFALAEARPLVAWWHGFESWEALLESLDAPGRKNSGD
jgi:ankyrin repeat protein